MRLNEMAKLQHPFGMVKTAEGKVLEVEDDFDKAVRFVDTMYASNRLTLPMKGTLTITRCQHHDTSQTS
jgi:hypothetical protein